MCFFADIISIVCNSIEGGIFISLGQKIDILEGKAGKHMNKKRKIRRKIRVIFGMSLMIAGVAAAAARSGEIQAKKKVLPKKIRISGAAESSAFRMSVGDSKKIGYLVTPSKAANKKVTFTTSNKKVAKVTAKGIIKGLKEGKTTVTIRSKAKKAVKAKVKVMVEKKADTSGAAAYAAPPVLFAPALGPDVEPFPVTPVKPDAPLSSAGTAATGLSLADEEGNPIAEGSIVEIAAGESIRLTAVVTPVTATDKVTWSNDFLGGINVYQSGIVLVTEDTPVDTTAKITASCRGLKASCRIVVIKGPCEHEWSDWAVTSEPSCTMEGVETSTCSKCSKKRERAVAALGHNFQKKTPLIKEPTCTEVGEAEYECDRAGCGETKREIVKANGHTWSVPGEVLEEPTCVKKGKIKYTCTVDGCDGEKTEPIDALGHTWDEGEIKKSPTCIAYGIREYHCTVEGCTGTKTENIEPTGHTWNYGEVTSEPTCVLAGKRVSVCLTCSAKRTVTMPATGHDWEVETVPSTCTERGTETSTCKICKEVRTKTLALKDHEIEDEYRIDVPATCTEVGKRSKHCKNCSYRTQIRNIPSLGHLYHDGKDGGPDEGVIDPEPTCVMPGIKTYTCQRVLLDADGKELVGADGKPVLCGAKRTELVTALGHDWTKDDKGKEVYTVDEPATCTQSGTKSVHCERDGCRATKNTSLIAPLGHDWDEDTAVIVEPTCTEEGTKTSTCKREVIGPDGKVTGTCGAKKLDILSPLGHKFDTDWTTDLEPNCSEPGRKSKHCLNKWKTADGTEETCPAQSEVTLIQPNGHTWSAWSRKTAPSHGKAGQEERTCGVCAAVQNRSTADGHHYDDSGKCSSCSEKLTMVKTTYEDWEYNLNETEGTVLLKKYTGTKDCILIPAKMRVKREDGSFTGELPCKFEGGYERRTKTGVFASNNKCKVKAVSFEDGVQITDMANMFYGCTDLIAVLHIPEKVTNMLGTFKDCTSLLSVGALPKEITELPETFDGCKSLVTAPELPEKVTSLYGTFKGCESLAKAPDLTKLKALKNLSFTFSGCTSMSQAPALPATVTEMTDTFRGTSLFEVPEDIPEGVTKLTTTFYGCQSLEFIADSAMEKLPKSIQIMEYTFKNCKNLTYAPPIPKTVGIQVDLFEECGKKVSVP